jgi:hypothetical protein
VWYNDGMPRVVPTLAIARTIASRPGVWLEALRTLASTVRRGWWRRPPFLPLPAGEYVAWRVTTAYGSPDGPVEPDDVVAYLAWRRRQRR